MKKKSSRLVLSLPLPLPQHELGYTDEELKTQMTAAEWDRFRDWMVGQTVGVNSEGKALTYVHDAERGIRLIRYGTPTVWD